MKVKIVERHASPSDAVRNHVISKTEALSRYFDRIISVDVVLSVEKERQIAEFHAHLTNRKVLHAHEDSTDMYASIDRAIDKLRRQLVKYKDQLTDTRERREGGSGEGEEAGDGAGEKRIVRTDTFFHKPMLPEEASLQLEAVDKGFLVFINAETDEVSIIYHRRDGNYGLIEPRR
ncbi:MAG: ribosome-associated translation inhibitor RaiA [Candidatus Bipolaricaulota bacterium]|nr:MAG: ribosome-associated translation inhibitor RaiA [Candidatus Bipolaricaulota bacterium]